MGEGFNRIQVSLTTLFFSSCSPAFCFCFSTCKSTSLLASFTLYSAKDMSSSGSKKLNDGKKPKATQRNPNRAFLHSVSWKEFRPFLHQLEQNKVDKETSYVDRIDFEEGDDEETYDASQTNLFNASYTEPEILNIVHKILVRRKADLHRGDVIRLQFIKYRCWGTLFYNGSKVIFAENEKSDYFAVPSEFLVPTEFDFNYWNDCSFLGWSKYGDFCFDVKQIKSILHLLQWKPVDKEEKIFSSRLTMKDGKTVTMVIVDYRDKNKKRGIKHALQVFSETGRCFNWNEFEENYDLKTTFKKKPEETDYFIYIENMMIPTKREEIDV